MTEKETRSDQAQDLRKQAEEIALGKEAPSPKELEAMSPEETRQTLHELRVHQIELEMQNEELRRIQVELDGSRARYFDLYDLAPVGYVTLSEQGLVLEANLTAATLMGVSRGTLVNRPLSRFILEEDQGIYYLHRTRLFETRTSQTCEIRMVRHDGVQFWARIEATVAQETGGAPICRASISNIHEQKRLETEKAELERQFQQLQKAESLGRMAGAIAHHFNNQLGVVIGNLEMAMEYLPRGSDTIPNLTAAMQAAGKAAEMSGLMLTYLGQSFDKRESLDLSETCLRSLPILRAAMPGNVAMDTDLPSPGPVISANANQIQQVISNLITNAWEAVRGNKGSIHLAVKTVSQANIPKSHRYPSDWQPQDNAYACIELSDRGCGIEAKDIEKLFDPFFSSKFTGRGMGLAVVMGIVRAHGGAITMESEAGQGSTFRVFFPVSGEAVFRQPNKTGDDGDILTSEVSSTEEEEKGTVLLVEDEETVRSIATSMLMCLGFSVLEARDGVEAEEMFRQRRNEIRCVLCDLTMPRMNGWETLTALRKLAPDIPVILASGYSEAQVMAGDHSERPQIFLGKPYNLKRLNAALSQALINKK